MTFISVVIPTYDSLSTVGDCLAALELQTYPRDSYELIVSDNGSKDGTQEYITMNFPNVILTRSGQQGSAYARNAGLAISRGTLILSTDADCIPDANWVSALVEVLNSESAETAAVGGPIVPFRTKTLVEKYRKAWVSQSDILNPNAKARYAATPNAAFRTQIIRDLGGFDGTAGHDDSDLGLRLEAAGYRVAFTDKAFVRHRNPITLSELYQHRWKYGERNYILATKHPHIFGDPRGASKRRQLLAATVRRVASDIFKLPLSYAFPREGLPAAWPLADAVLAVGNYKGFSARSRKEQLH